jgi:hypothetical protein
MRGRAWRIHTKEIHTIRRLRNKVSLGWYWHRTANFERKSYPRLVDFIKTESEFESKTISTSNWESKNKSKFSPNKSKEYWRNSSMGTREYEKSNFRKILKENELI